MPRIVSMLLLLAALAAAQSIPDAARAELDRAYPGWKLAQVSPQIQDFFHDSHFGWQPNVMPGDFDGDGRPDLAVRILVSNREHVVALMNRDASYQAAELAEDAPDTGTFLLLYKKGERDFDHLARKQIVYQFDSVGVMYFARTALTFTWNGSGFDRRRALTDDEAEQERTK